MATSWARYRGFGPESPRPRRRRLVPSANRTLQEPFQIVTTIRRLTGTGESNTTVLTSRRASRFRECLVSGEETHTSRGAFPCRASGADQACSSAGATPALRVRPRRPWLDPGQGQLVAPSRSFPRPRELVAVIAPLGPEDR